MPPLVLRTHIQPQFAGLHQLQLRKRTDEKEFVPDAVSLARRLAQTPLHLPEGIEVEFLLAEIDDRGQMPGTRTQQNHRRGDNRNAGDADN